jgi:signal transduction histidine kinase
LRNRDTTWDFPNQAGSGDLDLAYIIPLRSGDKEIGVLCVSQKITRQAFSPDDLFLLQGIGSLASIAVSSAMLVQDVSTRDTFVSVASHELRSPLTAILGYADLLLKRDPPEAKRKAWLNSILVNARTVAALVDDLLNVTRIRSGKLVMKLESADLHDILANKMELAPEISQKHQFVIDVPPELPKVLVDRSKLGQIIDNLISNAIKYSPAGGEIRLAARQDPASNRVIISLQDHGIGISPGDSELLFTTFHRIKRPETEGVKGNGLGLYIAKEWTEAMGGKIWLSSKLNEGSTFWVAVPAARTNDLPGEMEDRPNIEEVVESK